MTSNPVSITDEPLSELESECETAMQLYRFMHKAYSNILDNCPATLDVHIRALNLYLFQELQRTLRDSLSSEDAYNLAAFLNELLAEKQELQK